MSTKSRNRNRKPGATAPSRAVREQKRAQFEGRRSNKLHIILATVALVVVAAIALYVTVGRGPGGTEAAATTATSSGDVKIALAKVNDGKAHFYSYDAGGVQVKYFVLKSSDGVVRAAFDACDVCFAQKKGYHQEGDEMVCNNCGQTFPSNRIGETKGGCNPHPLARRIEGQYLVVRKADIAERKDYFARKRS